MAAPADDLPARRSPGPRRSTAALRASQRQDSERNVTLALGANLVVAAAEFAIGVAIGSAAMLAEAVHSTADSINEVLLEVSLYHGRRPADAVHPRGYAGARFLWAFVAAIMSFVIGGCLSIAIAVYELLHGAPIESFAAAWIVLIVAFVANSVSLLRSLALARQEAARSGLTTKSFLQVTSEPTIRAVVVEDAASLVGVVLAAGGLLLHRLAGWESADPIAALLIGLLLAGTAVGLARPLADLLIGRSLPPEQLDRVRTFLSASPSVDQVVSVYATYDGPQEVLVAAKVRPTTGRSMEELAADMDEIDGALRGDLPEIADVFIDITLHGTGKEIT